MGLIFRSVAGLSLLFLVLPIDVSGETTGEKQVNPIQALFAARDAVADFASICERQPDVCATAAAAITTIIARAKESVRLAQSLSGEPAAEPDPARPQPSESIPAKDSAPPTN